MKKFGRWRLLIAAALVAMAAVPGAALASEHDADEDIDDDAREFAAVVEAHVDEVLQLLIFGISTPDAEAVDCSIPDGVVLERDDDPLSGDAGVTVVEGEWEVPESCSLVHVAGPNGQVNHGQVVSNFVHALKAMDRSAIDVPFGQLVRQIAGSDLGKEAADDVDDDEFELDDDSDEADDEGHGPPPHANNDKDKKAKGDKGNNGNGPNK